MSRDPQDVTEVERSLTAYFDDFRETVDGPRDMWQRIAPRLAHVDDTPRRARGSGVPRWIAVGVVAASLVVVAAVLPNWLGADRVASAQEILQRAEATALSPQAAGIERLAFEVRTVLYRVGEEQRGTPYFEGVTRGWYETPNRARIEWETTELTAEGDVLAEQSSLAVWDGSEYWRYDGREHSASVVRQDPNADIYEQGVLYGGLPAREWLEGDPACREARVTGQDAILGRPTDVVELSRPKCGFTPPGSDGRMLIWVDRETGFVLRTEQFAIEGGMSAMREVTALEINGAIDGDRLSFSPPPDADVADRRDQPLGIGTMSRMDPRSVSLEEAIALATFKVRVPASVPAGFELESVQLWPGAKTEERPTVANDWVLLRYADADGNWLVISQGFGGVVAALVEIAPPDIERGTLEVRGGEATWVDGSPFGGGGWEPGMMRALVIDAGRVGSGWAVDPDGRTVTGSPLHIALASNTLSVEELVAVAETLE